MNKTKRNPARMELINGNFISGGPHTLKGTLTDFCSMFLKKHVYKGATLYKFPITWILIKIALLEITLSYLVRGG